MTLVLLKDKLKFYLLLGVLFMFFVPFQPALAHSGTGPPFAKVNGKYATTNPLFQGAPTDNGLIIPQDIAPDTYRVKEPLTLSIDTSQLGLDETTASTTLFRWSFSRGENLKEKVDDPVVGNAISKTFASMGSYLVTIEVKTPKTDFTLIDTILLQIVPNNSYTLPHSIVAVQSPLQSNKTNTFTNKFDQEGSKYLWDFNENNVEEGKSVEKTFKQSYFYTPVVARVFDKNGFISDTEILVVGDNGNLTFSLLDSKAPTSSLTVTKSQSGSIPVTVIIGINIVLLLSVMLLFFFARKKKS